MDISNGEGIGVSLFVQGCHFHCKNCFNKDTWDFNGGKEWTEETQKEFLKLANKPYIKRISVLGGEPLANENVSDVLNLVNQIRLLLPNKTIWLYTGFTWETVWDNALDNLVQFGIGGLSLSEECEQTLELVKKRREIIKQCDVLIDGRYVDSLRNIQLKYRGSENQRVIDIKKSLEQNKIVLWCD